ncbi:hypothetical protein [Paractinoplanes atraurantiacus]|uniref:Uncharacterized protein n=1 Tax=Paractinoplanes atraurantiacus TaxID=1036182 RepID=A0A285KHX2_9ACTN|nr:hypothetical protein [Actinoplanes atraurantiacus]SNY72234.1 hypothetical protein SAMN05421748_14214 [Actinoplanes atraurantiacus]
MSILLDAGPSLNFLAVGQQNILIRTDDLTTWQFAEAVTRISGMPAQDRVRSRKSLGEIMVLAHASVFVQQGQEVFV